MNIKLFKKYRGAYLLLLPAILFFIIFSYIPMSGLVIAFKDFRLGLGIIGSPWCGLENFQVLFENANFIRVIRNTLVISFLKLFFVLVVPIILALMLNEVRLSAFKKGIQTLTFIPHFISWVILSGIFLMLFGIDGPLNKLIVSSGGDPIGFMTSDVWFITIIIATGVWQTAGYTAVIYLAAISGINPNLYDAASVDGANRWQQTWYITLKALQPTIIIMFILSVGGVLNSGFDQIFNMYNPQVYDVGDILGTWLIRRFEVLDFAGAAAGGLLQSVLGMFLVCLTNSLSKRFAGKESGLW